MASTCTNSTRENNSSHACMPLSKMPISLAHGIIRSSVLLIFLTASFVGNIVLAFVLQRKPQLLQVSPASMAGQPRSLLLLRGREQAHLNRTVVNPPRAALGSHDCGAFRLPSCRQLVP